MWDATGQYLDDVLYQKAGSYLQTVRYESRRNLLCPLCGGFKAPNFTECYSCNKNMQQRQTPNGELALADRAAFGVYAVEPNSQTLKMMYGYKEVSPESVDYRKTVKAIASLALVGHRSCLEELAKTPLSAWVMVPSTRSSRRFGREHPLHSILAGLLRGVPEVQLVSNQEKTRNLDPDAFSLREPYDNELLSGNVLLIDDSWVTGGTVQSAAARLKREGATQVSVYCISRIVNTNYLGSIDSMSLKAFSRSVRYARGYCPWNRCIELLH